MKIGTRVYVSFLSGSKIAGEVGTIVGVSTRDGYKVRTDFGVVGYVKRHHTSEIFEDAPTQVEKLPLTSMLPLSNAEKATYINSLMDIDVAHMYLTPILPLKVYPADIEARLPLPDPTDLLCRAVRFVTPFTSSTLGWVSDQWIEDGVELLNVVHNGSFTVVPRSFVTDVFTILSKNKTLVRVI